MFIKRRLYKKHQDTPKLLEIMKTMSWKSDSMCAGECTGNTDCAAFRVEEDECVLMQEGTGGGGVLMQNIFIKTY